MKRKFLTDAMMRCDNALDIFGIIRFYTVDYFFHVWILI